MAYEFRLPDVGEGLHEAEIVRWLVKEGDMVAEDQPLVEVQTDKVTTEIPSPVAGRVVRLAGQPGDVVEVGSVIVVLEPVGAAAPAAEPAPGAAAVAPVNGAAAAPRDGEPLSPPAPSVPGAVPAGRPIATPAIRRRAREMGIDLRQVRGTGPAGRITAADLEAVAAGRGVAAAAPAAPALVATAPEAPAVQTPAAPAAAAPAGEAQAPAAGPRPGQRLPLRGVRRVIAEAMVRSKHTAPHVTVMDEVEVSALVALREEARRLAEARGVKLTYLPFVVKAAVAALREFPYLNASLDDERQEIVLHDHYHIGIATDTDGGLMVPVVKDADRKRLIDLAAEIAGLAGRARAGKLSLDELKGSTFTISNIGTVGAGVVFTPVINHPEVAILGVGTLAEKPVVKDGALAVGKVLHLSLSFDHRVVDGAMAGRFLRRVMDLLANPTMLLLEMM
ncbi:dihydrolipoamide acetyltransferase family protein [Caldinitratiruptor microaerophilus]|uniref:Dihydrolipoamide acetyltransferase component of pyruvate dehydrogenase complex n=1 Tax=Caldinitratiruptor microaerophilus TaxID=671077 RepID=A0AA35GA97_9FIRM|nr:dihydrolipoamide acetyltransferase family protein [Caldinitratiruptor microaerophilus]BDG62283.1 dihydrolipoamide acetyltransferase component of pyruvate dehydrogenase complex [Caldinitratiruptor microaerophilus]